MSLEGFPVGMKLDVSYPEFKVSLTFLSTDRLRFEIKEGPYARTETVDIQVASLGNSVFVVSWREESGATVINVQDHDRGLTHSFATLPDGTFFRMVGAFSVIRPADHPSDARPQRNKALVLEAMTSLFQERDVSAVARLYAPDYVQHNPNIPQGRDALQALVADLSPSVFYEPGLVVADGDMVAIHGRIRGWADVPQVVVDLFRVEEGRLAEHWDVLQDEVPPTGGGAAMFDTDEGRLSDQEHR